ncbi:unnamed protein product [Acanthosepion pharaonis]|uniref:Uncharacterized protein n=1 Tax=Acanthosepion pharaonis TaxID=158019 RepID=A0A812AQ90_ACAPH|nr:unnamed protein product [Sepia pharaonis]
MFCFSPLFFLPHVCLHSPPPCFLLLFFHVFLLFSLPSPPCFAFLLYSFYPMFFFILLHHTFFYILVLLVIHDFLSSSFPSLSYFTLFFYTFSSMFSSSPPACFLLNPFSPFPPCFPLLLFLLLHVLLFSFMFFFILLHHTSSPFLPSYFLFLYLRVFHFSYLPTLSSCFLLNPFSSFPP